jgi:hypothetical protein
VQVGADSRPPALIEGPVVASSAAANLQVTGNDYSAFWQQAMAMAQDARTDAAPNSKVSTTRSPPHRRTVGALRWGREQCLHDCGLPAWTVDDPSGLSQGRRL